MRKSVAPPSDYVVASLLGVATIMLQTYAYLIG